jgi:hypothetical protein
MALIEEMADMVAEPQGIEAASTEAAASESSAA